MIRTVKTENGVVRGLPAADPRITAFKGIPFAAPPIGENRWRAPQPCKNWEGVLNAYEFAPISVQDTPGIGNDIYCREWHVDKDIPMGEDCLYLNVWTNAKTGKEKMPVLVWFFGGALQWGYPAEMEFDGERIARRDVVVVTVNYRINVFGFLSHPELTKSQPEAPANFGNLDQQAGLKWVVRNIEVFGGDPKNITIAGQSAGGGSVLSQLAYPGNKGLFQKAVIMSAMIRSPYGGGIGAPENLSSAENNGKKFFEYMGVKSLEEARQIDAFEVLHKYNEFVKQNPRMATVEDHVFCIGDPLKLLAENKCIDVPIMAGNTADEFPNVIMAENETEFRAKVDELFGKDAKKFLQFPETKTKLGENQYVPINGIECTVKSVFLNSQKNGHNDNCYYYRFDTDIPGWDNPGTFHSVDLWFFFETLAKSWRPFKGKHYDLARYMCNYFTNFIKTGNPNGNDQDGKPMPKWEKYKSDNAAEIIFKSSGVETKCGIEKDFTTLLMKYTLQQLLEK